MAAGIAFAVYELHNPGNSIQSGQLLMIERLTQLIASVPAACPLQITVVDYSNGRVSLHAPLLANINDKGCAFGGSLSTVMTLAGWGLLSAELEARDVHADVFVASQQTRFLIPVFEDLHVHAELDRTTCTDWDGLVDAYTTRGKCRATLLSTVALSNGKSAATATGLFVAKARIPG